MARIDLNVPYAEKEAAKALGAKWDAPRRTWYVPNDLASDAFSRWLPQPPNLRCSLTWCQTPLGFPT